MQGSRGKGVRRPRALLALLCVSAVAVLSVQPSTFASPRSALAPTQLWAKRYNGPPSGTDAAYDLAVSPDGSHVFVTGFSVGSTSGADYATVAYSSSGAKLWIRRFNGSENTGDVGRAVVVSPDGSTVFVTGRSHGLTTGDDYGTVAYDVSTGKQLWASSYTGPKAGDDEATSLAVSPDSATVFVTGHSHGTGTGADYATVAYDASTGAPRWVSRYNGPANLDDAGLAIGVSPDGSSVFVTGRSPSSTGGIDYATVAYDAATGGPPLWVSRYNGPVSGDDIALSLGVSADGGTVFVTGDSPGSGTGADFATVAYNASTGGELWVTRYNGSGHGDDFARALASSPDSSTVFVTGDSRGSTSAKDYATVAYDASTGMQVWARRYNGPANRDDVPRALRLSSDGATVYVTGKSRGSGSGDDYGTVAYRSSTGSQLWVSRYNAPANGDDSASGMGVSPDGLTLFATGRSMGTTTGDDYATVAFTSGA